MPIADTPSRSSHDRPNRTKPTDTAAAPRRRFLKKAATAVAATGAIAAPAVSRAQTTSFRFQSGDGRLVLEATSALVAYDYEADAAMAVPEDWRTRLDAYEERSSVAT